MFIINVPSTEYQIILDCCDDAVERFIFAQFYPHTYYNIQDYIKPRAYIYQAKEDIRYHLEGEKEEVLATADILFAMRKIIESFLIPKEDYLFFHAACIAKGSSAVLLLGESMAGKSTLSTYLFANGFDYLTDDYTIIQQSNNTIEPFKKLIHIRQGTEQLLKRKGVNVPVFNFGTFDRSFIFPTLTRDERKYKLIAGIVLGSYTRNTNNTDSSIREIVNITQKRTFFLENLFTTSDLLQDIVKVNRLIADIPLYFTVNNDLDATSRRISNVLEALA